MEVVPIEIRLDHCKLRDVMGTDYPMSLMTPENVTVVMKLSYFEVGPEWISDLINPEMTFSWNIELYKYNHNGDLILEDGFMAPRDLFVVDDHYFLASGQHNYSLWADLNDPKYFHIIQLGDERAEKDFLIESDDTSWVDYYVDWAYFTSISRVAFFKSEEYSEKKADENKVSLAKTEIKKYTQLAKDLLEHYPNGVSDQRDKKLPTLKQLDRRMKANFSISNYFDPVTPAESNLGNTTTSLNNKPTQTTTTQPKQPPQSSSTTSSSYSSNSSTYNKYSRWPLFYSNPVFGFRFGYAQRAFRSKGSVLDINVENPPYLNVFGEHGVMNGFQAGFFVIPSRKSMLTLYFGLNYEMYFCSGKNAQNYNREYKEINLYAPFDLTFHVPFSRRSALYVHGGLGFDYSCYNNYSSLERNENGRNASDKFNISWECGLDLKIQGLILYANFQKGISKHYPYGYENPMELDKMSVGIAFGF